MNAQMLYFVCLSASLAAFGIVLITRAGLMLILKRQQQQTASTSVLARLTFRPSELASKSNTTDSVVHVKDKIHGTEPLLHWLERFYVSECDGDWEHQYGVKIETLDNPGWMVKVDVFDTELHDLHIEYAQEERSASDWLGIELVKQRFRGVGDPYKLTTILERFRRLVEENRKGTLPSYLDATYPGRWQVEKR